MTKSAYPGGKLALFAKASRWKSYWRSRIAPFVRGSVLEVGAGSGANTTAPAGLSYDRWLCLEPDAALAAQLNLPCGGRHRVLTGTLASIDPAERFDTILYLDVLEHIEDDRGEMARAAAHLEPGGAIVVLGPAHPFLFGPFDAAVGHYRRYTKRALRSLAPAGLIEREMAYLDSAGVIASACAVALRQSLPTQWQILFWDRILVPFSQKILDPMLCGSTGKSILGIWTAGGVEC